LAPSLSHRHMASFHWAALSAVHSHRVFSVDLWEIGREEPGGAVSEFTL